MKALRKEDEAPLANSVAEQLEAFLEKRRPAPELRDQVDLGYTYQNDTVEIFEIRPQWNNKEVIRHHPVAKAKFIKTKNIWKIYWMRTSLKWAAYDPLPEVKEISQFLEAVAKDAHNCFFG